MTRGSKTTRGRGAGFDPDNRYSATRCEEIDDGWEPRPEAPLRTSLAVDSARSIISRNDSPDIPFEQSVNPYRGCEHGCIYCFARPSHAWLDLSPGLDFETRLLHKPEAAALLRTELARRGYRPRTIALGSNTDVYQPVERGLGLTRQLLAVLLEARHPVMLISKSSLIERDIDLLGELAALGLVSVAISVTTLQRDLARRMEPRAAAPERRLSTISRLQQAGIPVGLMLAPVIPVLTDSELEEILQQAREAGAGWAGYVLLRLPLEVAPLFRDWLQRHYPDMAAHVMARVRDCRGGQDNESAFGRRMRGQGPFADLIAQRFHIACRRLGFGEEPSLRTDLFRPPAARDVVGQLPLF